MTFQIGFVLVLIVIAAILFLLDRIPADVVGLMLVVTLVVSGILTTEQAYSGFGSETVLLFLGLLVMSAALRHTGVVDLAGSVLLSMAGTEARRVLFVVMVSTAVLSAFMSNTAATAFFLPVVFGLARQINEDASKFLLPLAFSSILTSSVTLISTSTNIVVSDLLTRYSQPPMGMFEMAPVGIPITLAGIAYLWFVGRHMLPERDPETDDAATLARRPYIAEVMVISGSPLVGRTLEQSGLGRELDLNVIRVVRDKTHVLPARSELELAEGDVLLVEAPSGQLLKVKDRAGIEFKPDAKLGGLGESTESFSFVEAIILPGSPLIGETLKDVRFRQRFSLQVLGIDRGGERIMAKVSQVRLRLGDILLLEGSPAALREIVEQGFVRVLGFLEQRPLRTTKSKIAIAIFIISLALGTAKLVPFSIAALIGAIAMFLSGCIAPVEAYREIEWKALILVGSMLALGTAMEATGTERYLAAEVVAAFGDYGTVALLAGFFALTVVLTQPMSNQAAAVVVVPVAIQTAIQLDANPRTFAMMVAVAASCSYLTPLEPSCLMVYGPGRYRFWDFMKVGLPLTVVIFAIALIAVPLVWPL